MLETTPRELMILVERVVRPLPVPLSRQQRLRTELLQHLQAIYAEEVARDADSAAALSRTTERFGNPRELAAELRGSVRSWEICESWLERAMMRRPSETETRYALRMTARFLIFIASLMGLIMLDHHFFGTEAISWVKIQVGGAALAFLAVWFGAFLLFGLKSGVEWSRSPRRWGQIIALSVGLIAAWPASLFIMMQLAGGTWSDYSLPLISSIGGGLLSVFCGTMIGTAHHRESQYRREWAELTIDAA